MKRKIDFGFGLMFVVVIRKIVSLVYYLSCSGLMLQRTLSRGANSRI